MNNSIEVVNVVATGELDTSINLEYLYDALNKPIIDYDPINHQGLYIRFYENGPLITVYNSGKYIIRANSKQEVFNQKHKFIELLEDVEFLENIMEKDFCINNIVANSHLNREIDIEALSDDLTNYETEIKPINRQLVYRMLDFNCTLLIFRTGTVLLTGAKSVEEAEEAWSVFIQELSELLNSES